MMFRKKISEFIIRQKHNSGKPITDFFGGIYPKENKSPANLHDINFLPIFPEYRVAIKQHIGTETDLIVHAGDKVLKGQPLTRGVGNQVPVHAPTSGTVQGFVTQPNASYFQEQVLTVQIQSDGLDAPYALAPFDYLKAKSSDIINEIHQCGIVGLGGAGFPTAVKVNHTTDDVSIDTIILNAAECEPYISADDRLMREHAKELIQGLDIIRKILHPKRILIGIEDNKPEAISALHAALETTSIDLIRLATKIIVVPTKYPSGGAKQLVTLLTGKEIPSGQHATALGILMLNVGTVYAVQQAIVMRIPLIERVVTFAGQLYQMPGNYWVRVGTPIKALMEYFNVSLDELDKQPLLMGGPMMGYAIDLDSSVVKTTNCLLARSLNEKPKSAPEQPCIRCGECVNVCPSRLLPQQLFWYSQGKEYEKATQHNLFDCIECGACEFVCPSHIPLVHYYKVAKQEIKTEKEEALMAQKAKERYEAKLKRIEAEKIAREERHKNINVNLNDKDKSAVEAAIARVKAKKAAVENTNLPPQTSLFSEDNSIVDIPATSTDSQTNFQDSKKAAIEAALARAKAKKLNQNVKETEKNTSTQSGKDDVSSSLVVKDNIEQNFVDPRKAAVEAALARAKARRAGQLDGKETLNHLNANDKTSVTQLNEDVAINMNNNVIAQNKQTITVNEPSKEENRKAAIIAAQERAKAKRTLHEQKNSDTPSLVQDDAKVITHHSDMDKESQRKKAIEQARLRAIAKRDEALKNNENV
ncbi:electron transport complex subunit RsxC [Thorsellia kenyensis]|uniref:Ion-translocating oxidoreductase complex subunit C n=1 Tax=Thorsellia kenyensis TaxID=1549888 RepID=A0ABV6C8L1_9GAMM